MRGTAWRAPRERAHRGRLMRAIVEVGTDEGFGGMEGGGEDAEPVLAGVP